jgi:pyruvate/2-oxoglutarate/acetoin dehydrogenase E1 component
MTQMTFSEAINNAMYVAMATDPKVLAFGLGICDPKAIFGTTAGLQDAFGKDRVFDMPVSENALTGMAVGAAIGGYKPVMVHQRLDFTLVSIDQIVNSAAKWFYMFGGQTPIPIVIRMIVGRGWGQGPTHSQALHAWFAHVPGLKVVLPSSAEDAKGLLLESIYDPNPVIFIEHRWLHNTLGEVPEGDYRVPLGRAATVFEGSDITLVATSLMTVEARRASQLLAAHGISCEVIDLRTVRPIDWATIEASVAKTGRMVALDIAHPTASIAAEIVAGVTERCFSSLKTAPARICLPDHAVPTSPALIKGFYPSAVNIVDQVASMMGAQIPTGQLKDTCPHDVPGEWFRGPF